MGIGGDPSRFSRSSLSSARVIAGVISSEEQARFRERNTTFPQLGSSFPAES
jgi:hypothetical protein